MESTYKQTGILKYLWILQVEQNNKVIFLMFFKVQTKKVVFSIEILVILTQMNLIKVNKTN